MTRSHCAVRTSLGRSPSEWDVVHDQVIVGRRDVVLAEYTQPFNEVDSTYYHLLYERMVAALGFVPPNVTADAAFDAWHIYQTWARHGRIAAIPLNTRAHPPPQRLPDGTPLCPTGLAMSPSY